MMDAHGSLCVVEHHYGSMQVDVFRDRLEMVLDSLDRGSLGGGSHGDYAHNVALRAVIHRAQTRLRMIEHPEGS